jgi:magnesium-transporting ATPase (P-type)
MVNIITSDQVKNFEEVKYLVETYPEDKLKNDGHGFLTCECKKISLFDKIGSMFLPKKPKIIAKKYNVHGAVIISGKEIAEFQLEHWDYVLSHKEIVFARTTPQNKLAIVKQLQRRGEIVTVTGKLDL